LPKPAQGQNVGIFQNGDYEGSRLEYNNSDGISCKFVESERPSLALTAGAAEPLIVTGGQDSSSRTTGATPVAGLTLRIPLGKGQANCDKLRELDLSQYRLKKAQQMFEDGSINKAQLDAIARKAYKALLNN
jgi:hypothetical protein